MRQDDLRWLYPRGADPATDSANQPDGFERALGRLSRWFYATLDNPHARPGYGPTLQALLDNDPCYEHDALALEQILLNAIALADMLVSAERFPTPLREQITSSRRALVKSHRLLSSSPHVFVHVRRDGPTIDAILNRFNSRRVNSLPPNQLPRVLHRAWRVLFSARRSAAAGLVTQMVIASSQERNLLRALATLRQQQAEFVSIARALGVDWQEIATATRMNSAQAAHQRWG